MDGRYGPATGYSCGKFAARDPVLRKHQWNKMKNSFHMASFNKITSKLLSKRKKRPGCIANLSQLRLIRQMSVRRIFSKVCEWMWG
jgi:hypothetical protein